MIYYHLEAKHVMILLMYLTYVSTISLPSVPLSPLSCLSFFLQSSDVHHLDSVPQRES